ncbi:MAG: Holliday junction branch migration protein RuvA [Patescibacteria group bacterium]
MIAFLSGTVLSKQDRTLVLNVNGVGYLVFATKGLLEKTPIGQELALHIHTNVREDDLSLYGFFTHEEWQFFRLLLTVSGIGPKSALEILNAPLKEVRQAIAKKDEVFLTRIPGIGRKTAQRMIVDLQGKIKEEILEESTQPGSHNDDIVQALIALGYHRQHVLQGLKKIPAEINNEEAIIKYFLQNI